MTGFGSGQAAVPPAPVASQPVASRPAVSRPAAPASGGLALPTPVARPASVPPVAQSVTAPLPRSAAPRLQPLDPVRPGPAAPAPHDAPRRSAPRLVLPIVAAELAAVLVLLVLDRSWPTIVAVACCGSVLAVFAAARVRGRLLSRWVALAWRFLVRPRAAELPDDGQGTEQGAAVLRLVRPGARCTRTAIGEVRVFLVSDETGVATVLRPESGRREPEVPALTPHDLLPGTDEQGLAYAVQVVHHTGVDRSQPPRVWLTLRVLRTAAVYADDDVVAALANAVRRVRRRLSRAGIPFRTLTEQETLGSYAALAHVNAGRRHVREDWWLWHSGPIQHATFRLDGWTDLSQRAAARLVRWLLAAAPGTAVTVSRTAHHRPTEPGQPPIAHAVLRIATSRPDALAAAVTDVARLAREVGVTLNRLDGQHVRGVAATLPLGVVELA